MRQIGFMDVRGKFGILSIILVVASITLILTKGVNKSVDFEGGTKITVKFHNDDIGDGDLNKALEDEDQKSEIAKIQSPTGSEFSVKVRNPDVEAGKEAEASLERLRRMERAFGSINDEEKAFLDLIRETSVEKLKTGLIAENPYGISATDAEVESTYADVAQKVADAAANATSLQQLAETAAPDRADQLAAGLRLAYPALNRTTPDLLNVILKRYNPLERPLDQGYQDIVNQVIAVRASHGDFITDLETSMAGVSVGEGEDLSKLTDFFKHRFSLGFYNIVSNETFSPSIAAELLSKAWEAILLAMAGILFYISVRFTLGYAVASVVALSHDVIIALGAFSLVGAELSNPVVAAFLTIVGYSLNDTIVVFDRIRDNLKGKRKPVVKDVMNTSINQTLSRTLVTSLTTFAVVLVIFLGANATLRDFAFPLLVGIIVGTYSSIFVASPVLLVWHDKYKSIVT